MTTSADDFKWVLEAKKALQWFISIMGPDEWDRRRLGVVKYFNDQKESHRPMPVEIKPEDVKDFSPIAVYSDWIAWYMYLIESIFLRLGCDDPFQSNRIYPFFATIGRQLDGLTKMVGVEERMKAILHESRNQPDSGLYELCVAALYQRNGWQVKFLIEEKNKKTPDLLITRGKEIFWVECKRLAKVTNYAEAERKEWQLRSFHLFRTMFLKGINASVDITFKVPIETTDPTILGATIYHYVDSGMINTSKILEHEQITFKATKLDLDHLNKKLKNEGSIRPNSPNMLEFLIGEYDIHGSYAIYLQPSLLEVVNPEDPLYILNEFYAELRTAAVVKWRCTAEESINRKAKDIKKILSKAIKQIPEDGNGIVHICYETVLGPTVELRRHAKIQETINSFEFKGPNIEAIYCNAIQPLAKVDGFDWAETTIYFEQQNTVVLANSLLFDVPGTTYHEESHWEEDSKKSF
jgi:hypothetical protein